MKRKILLILFCSIIIMSFTQDNASYSYTAIIMTRTDLENSIKFTDAKDLKEAGKIYCKDSLIYIVERYKGIHVINNVNPSAPLKSGFIIIPGCIDLAIKDHFLFADNAVDLVSIDIAAFPAISVAARIKKAFPELTPPDLDYIPNEYTIQNRPTNTVIVGWEIIK